MMDLTHEKAEEHLREEIDWPEYWASGESITEPENWVPAYYEVKGPNGPVSYMNPDSPEPVPTTMFDFAMEAQSTDFRPCDREETPFGANEE